MLWPLPFSVDFSDNNFGCDTKKCMWAEDRKQLYYKSWPKILTVLAAVSAAAFLADSIVSSSSCKSERNPMVNSCKIERGGEGGRDGV